MSLGASAPGGGAEGATVTIAIPTFNRAAKFLPNALAAACNQTYRDLDILVSDNASSDATGEVVAAFADPRIRYHRHPRNIGSAANFNFCIAQSLGKYTLLLLDDDAIDPDFVESCMNALRDNPGAGLIRTGTRAVDENGVLQYNAPNLAGGLSFTQFVIAWTEGKTAPFMCSTMFLTSALKESGMHSRNNLLNDIITELPIAFRLGRVDIAEIKATFCMHTGQITSGVRIKEWCDDSLQLIDLVCGLAPSDAVLLRARLTPFLATLSYSNALRLKGWWPKRLAACWTIYRMLAGPARFGPFLREGLEQTRWFGFLLRGKRAIARRLR